MAGTPTPALRPAEPRIATLASAVMHRVPWPDAEVTLNGQRVQLITLVTEILRAVDGIGIPLGDPGLPLPSALDVDEAARLLAAASPRYSEAGLTWRAIFHPDNLEHAYTKAREAARDAQTLDRLADAHLLLLRHLAASAGPMRRGSPHEGAQSATVSNVETYDGGGRAGQGASDSPATGTTAASPS